MVWIIHIGKFCLKIIYGILKLFPEKTNKVLFLSRQSDELSLDFSMLKDSLERKNPKVKVISICNRLDDSGNGAIGFGVDTLKSMYHLATSKVCVLDAYWPAVSLLNHKASLTVIQMWHAIGKIKKSGYQTLGKESGRGEVIAKAMQMHEHYDIIIAGGTAWNQYYCESFNTTEDKLLNIGLPRIDHLLETEEKNKQEALEAYPQLQGKKVLLYAPTFRRNIQLQWGQLLREIDFNKYTLIIKGHPNQQLDAKQDGVLTCPEFKAVDLLAVCDYLITDYSAIAVEAAVLNKKTCYYLYDYEEYSIKNGLNLNPFETMPGCAFMDAQSLINFIDSETYPQEALDNYRMKYLPRDLGMSTEKLVEAVLSKLENGKGWQK